MERRTDEDAERSNAWGSRKIEKMKSLGTPEEENVARKKKGKRLHACKIQRGSLGRKGRRIGECEENTKNDT